MHPPPAPSQITQSNQTALSQTAQSNRAAPTSTKMNLYKALLTLSASHVDKDNMTAPNQITQSNQTAPNPSAQSIQSTRSTKNSKNRENKVDNVEIITFNYRELRLEGTISYYASLGECLSTGENVLARDTNVRGEVWRSQQQRQKQQQEKRKQQRRQKRSKPQSPLSKTMFSKDNGEAASMKGKMSGQASTSTASSFDSTIPPNPYHQRQPPSHPHHHNHQNHHQHDNHHITPPPLLRHPDPPLQLRQVLARVVNPPYLSPNPSEKYDPSSSGPENTILSSSSSSFPVKSDRAQSNLPVKSDRAPLHRPVKFREEFHEKWSARCASWTHPLVIVLPVYKGTKNSLIT